MLLFKFASYFCQRFRLDGQPVLQGRTLRFPHRGQILQILYPLDPAAASPRSLHLVAHWPETADVFRLDFLLMLQALPSGHQARLPLMSASGAAFRDSDPVAVCYIFYFIYHIFQLTAPFSGVLKFIIMWIILCWKTLLYISYQSGCAATPRRNSMQQNFATIKSCDDAKVGQ